MIEDLKGGKKFVGKMGYRYTPTYYSSLQDSISTLCKNMLPSSFKKRLLPSSERNLWKQQSDNLKWQQDSFHQILNLMGLHREGIVNETEVSAFRSHLLETLIVSRPHHEHPSILRDKLIFLQELLHAKCISSEEYHASKRPLLQRLSLQGAEIDARDVVVGASLKENRDEEWSVIDLKDEQCLSNKENSHHKNKTHHVSAALKQIKGAASAIGLKSSFKHGKNREGRSIFELPGTDHHDPVNASASKCGEDRYSGENPFWNQKETEAASILMPESVEVQWDSHVKVKKKAFLGLFSQHDDRLGDANKHDGGSRSTVPVWPLDGMKKRKGRGNEDNEGARMAVERSDIEPMSRLAGSRIWECPDTKEIKRKLQPDGCPSDFFIDKIRGEKIKEELSRIQTELSSTNPNLKFSSDQIEEISTRLPVDKADLKKFFPKSWCDRHGDVVLDVVKKEFKEHVGEMGSMRTRKKEKLFPESRKWSAYPDDENCHPNLF